MKKNLSGFVLAAEILIVILFHTLKNRESETVPTENAVVKVSKSVVNIPKSALLLKIKPEYFFVNMLK
jgi:hypothetical protein